jgi:hypothetical protein
MKSDYTPLPMKAQLRQAGTLYHSSRGFMSMTHLSYTRRARELGDFGFRSH